MSEFSIIALDLAKNVFQMHGADASGTVLFRKKLRRDQILKCLAAQPTCTVATRLCGMAGAYPLQRSTGGKQKLGKTSRMGERTLRRLLIIGASAAVRWAMRKDSTADSWLARMLALKPPMLVIVALANKMARIVWALMARGGTYRAPAAAK
ncbi:transposase [Bradyrhizobium japonicum]